MAMDSTYHNNVLQKATPEEETELIQSVSLSQLEKKIRELIDTNADIFPASSMEYTLHKARELEGKIAELIRATFRQINESPTTFKTRPTLNNSTCENLVMELITENVGLLLSLGQDASGETLTDVLNKCRIKIKSLVSENVEQLMLRLKDVEETLKDYTERVIKIKALRLAAVMLNPTNNGDDIEDEDDTSKPIAKELKSKQKTKEVAVLKNFNGHISSGLNVTAFKIPHLRPMFANQNVNKSCPTPTTTTTTRKRKQFLLKCFKNDCSQEKYRAYVYNMPSFKRTAPTTTTTTTTTMTTEKIREKPMKKIETTTTDSN